MTISSATVNFANNRYTPQQEEEMVKGVLSWARTQSYAIGGCARVSVTVSDITATVFRTCGPPLADPKETQSLTVNNLRLSPFTTGNPLIFYPSGGTRLANSARLRVDSPSGVSYDLVVYPLIGTIKKE
ncbi:MAG: hypothetical protein A4S09_01210 [Proteobacteria bacterium SG_bin7]|nr:MAG: hypothetical protein A4S09_01210 [Proteobacteria bacterium SG_bin7]